MLLWNACFTVVSLDLNQHLSALSSAASALLG